MSLRARLFSLYLRYRFKRMPPDDEEEFVRLARRLMNDRRRIPLWTPRDIGIEPADIARGEGGGGRVGGEWVSHELADEKKVIIYFHGGGYIAGAPVFYRKTIFHLARLTRARILVIDYRLAPEDRLPAAVDDGFAAYRHVLKSTDRRRVAFIGDSAGGGLLLATMHKARRENVRPPAAGVCFSPYTDLAVTGASVEANAETCVMFHPETLRIAAPVYLGDADPRDPLASPLYGDFKGFPPLQVFASSSETLLDDSLRLIEKATDSGVRVEKVIGENLPHVWPVFPEYLPEAREALRKAADFIAGAWAEAERAGVGEGDEVSGASAAPPS